MPVTGTTQTIKEEIVTADGWEVIAIHIVKPIEAGEVFTADNPNPNPARIRVVWGCTLAGVDTGETVEVNLEGQEVVDYMASIPATYADLLAKSTELGKTHNVLPPDAS